MALISIIEGFHPLNDAKLLDEALRLEPTMYHSIVSPVGGFRLKERYSSETEEIVLQNVPQLALGKGENLCLDFGRHLVGYITLNLTYRGSHPDAPAFLKLRFAETFRELSENPENYDGWVSSSWIQEEYIHLDVLPAKITLPRRYAFRYLKITMMDTSPKYKLMVRRAECMTETSAHRKHLKPFSTGDAQLDRIYEVSLTTLENCMQSVYEDGPKRDQRLWMGDFRLQALVNSVSFENYDLTKRCLYLFGGSRFEDGRVSACLFTKPVVEADDTYLFDYALLYAAALEEYLEATGDEKALEDLYEIAMQQIDISLAMCDERHVVRESAVKDTFIDWSESLDKTACAQAVLIYCIGFAKRLAQRRGDRAQEKRLSAEDEQLKRAAVEEFWNEEKQCFVSNGQASLASQVWMVLAGVISQEKAAELMAKADTFLASCPITTPYMYHYYVSALLKAGLKEKALDVIRAYWGSMLDAGADTFWESWDPKQPDASPYGSSTIINSFCHAWSCTPAYILKTLFEEKDQAGHNCLGTR